MSPSTTEKDKGVAYLCWVACFVGFAGVHRLYQGKIGTGFLWMFTWGLFGVGQFIDLFTLGRQIEEHNRMLPAGNAPKKLTGGSSQRKKDDGRAIPNINYLRQRFEKLDQMHLSDLITEEEFSKRKHDIIVDVAGDSDEVEDVIMVAGQLKDEQLLSEEEFDKLKDSLL
jgi:TM2 domain-containing membrane protein YozV